MLLEVLYVVSSEQKLLMQITTKYSGKNKAKQQRVAINTNLVTAVIKCYERILYNELMHM